MSATKRSCFPNLHMRPEEFALWSVCRSISHETGILYFDARKIAKCFETTGKNRVYRAEKGLLAKGWFKVLTPSRRDTRTGLFTPTQYKVLSGEEWVAANPHQCLNPIGNSPVSSPQNGTGIQSRKRERPVPKTGMTSPQNGTYIVEEYLVKEDSESAAKIEKPLSLAEPLKDSGQEKVLTDYIVRAAKTIKPQASFSSKAKEQLKRELSEITPLPTEAELKQAVTDQVSAMDPFSLKNAGSNIASGLVGAIGAIRDIAKATQERKDDKRTIERSEIARNDWRKKLDEATDIDQYVQDNPPPAWFVEYEGGKKSFPYADEYIEEARQSLLRRNPPQLIEAVF